MQNATEEWLRHIETNALKQRYNIKGYKEETPFGYNSQDIVEDVSSTCAKKGL